MLSVIGIVAYLSNLPEPVVEPPVVKPPIVNDTKPPVNDTKPPVVNDTKPEPPKPVPETEKNVIMVGDIYGDVGKTVAQSIKAKNPELVVVLGDLGYGNDADYLNEVYGDLKGKLACVIGNHDDGIAELEQYCGEPYFIKLNNVLFVGLNTESGLTTQRDQTVTLLKDSEFMENITSVHLMSHYPCAAPPGSHHPAESNVVSMCNAINAATSLQMFYDNGHNHGLAEGKLADGTWVHQSGGGGRSSYDCDTNTTFPYCDNIKGFLEYVIKPNGDTTWTFYNENGVKIR